jgi:hypothetical protein
VSGLHFVAVCVLGVIGLCSTVVLIGGVLHAERRAWEREQWERQRCRELQTLAQFPDPPVELWARELGSAHGHR